MRRIRFDGSAMAKENFRIVYESWVLSARGFRGLEALTTACDVKAALESISDSIDQSPEITIKKPEFRALPPETQKATLRAIIEDGTSGLRVLKNEGGVLSLEEPAYTMLKSAVDSMEWRPAVVDIAKRAVEMMAAAPKEPAA